MTPKQYKLGELETNIWSGDTISKCEFIAYLPFGVMVFREISPVPCLRAVYYEIDRDGNAILNGWCCDHTLTGLKRQIDKKFADCI